MNRGYHFSGEVTKYCPECGLTTDQINAWLVDTDDHSDLPVMSLQCRHCGYEFCQTNQVLIPRWTPGLAV